MNEWQAVWERKGTGVAVQSGLGELLARDGFDSGPGAIDEETWQRYVNWAAEKLGITSHDWVLEIGCGSGAFLYELAKRVKQVAGTDFSAGLIEVARRAIPAGTFAVAEARDHMDEQTMHDVVFTNSVFQYFPSFSYAEDVVTAMVEHSSRAVAILDIYDEEQREAMQKLRQKFLGSKALQQKYEGLEHLYFDRNWFRQEGERLNVQVEVFDQPKWLCDLSGYRFSVVMRKKQQS